VDEGIPHGAITHAIGWHLPDLSDFCFRFTIFGDSVPKKNTAGIQRRGGKLRVGYSAKAVRWEERLAFNLRADWYGVFREPLPDGIMLNAAIVTYLASGHRKDADGLYAAPQDALQVCRTTCKKACRKHGGVIVDDYWIRTHNGSDRRIDRTRPRVEITLTPYAEADAVGVPQQEEIDF
jgi:hypothetical protein